MIGETARVSIAPNGIALVFAGAPTAGPTMSNDALMPLARKAAITSAIPEGPCAVDSADRQDPNRITTQVSVRDAISAALIVVVVACTCRRTRMLSASARPLANASERSAIHCTLNSSKAV